MGQVWLFLIKIYKVLTKFFITIAVEVKFAFIQMDFRVDVAMTEKPKWYLDNKSTAFMQFSGNDNC